jgi:two-component system response regulator NreC
LLHRHVFEDEAKNIRIVLADDHRILRKGLQSLLERRKHIEVIAEAGTGREAVRQAMQYAPDIVIMDVSMPDLNGVEATREIVGYQPGVRVIGLSMHADHRFVSKMLQAGAVGYVLKDSAFGELSEAIETVMQDRIYLSPGLVQQVIEDYVRLLSAETDSYGLTAREREVLQLIAEGKTSKQIAERLHVSVKTVETHRQQLMDKLHIHNIAELTKFAIREGLTSEER